MTALLLCCCLSTIALVVDWKLGTASLTTALHAWTEGQQLLDPPRDAVATTLASLCPELQQAEHLLLQCNASQDASCSHNRTLHGVTPLTPAEQYLLWEEGDPLSSVVVHHPTYRLPHPSGKRVGIVFVMFAAYTADNMSPEAEIRMTEQFEGLLGASSVFLNGRDSDDDLTSRQLPVYVLFSGSVSPAIVALALRFDVGVVVVPQSPPLSTCAPPHRVNFEPFRHMLVKTIPYGLEDHFDLLLTMDTDVALTRIPSELFDRLDGIMKSGDVACAPNGKGSPQAWGVMPLTSKSCNAGILMYKPSRVAFEELLDLMRSDHLDCYLGDQKAVIRFLKEQGDRFITYELPCAYNALLHRHDKMEASDVVTHHFVHSTRPESLKRQLSNKADIRYAREAWSLYKTQQSWGHRQLLMHGLPCLLTAATSSSSGEETVAPDSG